CRTHPPSRSKERMTWIGSSSRSSGRRTTRPKRWRPIRTPQFCPVTRSRCTFRPSCPTRATSGRSAAADIRMKIAKGLLLDPERNFWFGTAAVAVSFFAFAYSTRFGQLLILAYYACWLPLIVVDQRRFFDIFVRSWWILGFALLACLSTFWSA